MKSINNPLLPRTTMGNKQIFVVENRGVQPNISQQPAAASIFPGNSLQAVQEQGMNFPNTKTTNVTGPPVDYSVQAIDFSAALTIEIKKPVNMIWFNFATNAGANTPIVQIRLYDIKRDAIWLSPGQSMRGWGCDRMFIIVPGGVAETGQVTLSFESTPDVLQVT